MRYKVVFTTDRGEWHQKKALEAAPKHLDILMLRKPDKNILAKALRDAQFLISERSGIVDAEIIQKAPRLKLIQRLGSLTHDIDLDAAARSGIVVCYLPVVGSIRVAEHLVMQMLALARKIREVEAVILQANPESGRRRRTDEDTFAYNWSRRSGLDQIWERTVGILGFGEIGVALARRLKGWGCTVLYHKRSRLPVPVEDELNVKYANLTTLVANSDYLVNLLPFLLGNEKLLNASIFAQMKDGAYLVSCGSGGTIDEAALAAAVRSGKLSGAALDTFEYEPIQADHPLITAAKAGFNVLLTPHIAAGNAKQGSLVLERAREYQNIVNFLNDEPLKYQVV